MMGWRKESLYSEYYKRRCGCTVCFEASACLKALDHQSTLISVSMKDTHSHTFTAAISTRGCYPSLCWSPFNVWNKYKGQLCHAASLCVFRRVWWWIIGSALCVCVCVYDHPAIRASSLPVLDGRVPAQPVSPQSWAAFKQGIWSAEPSSCANQKA